jgi:hypothetical protein
VNNQNRKLIALRKREDIACWFIEKAPQWGFEVSCEHLQVEDIAVKRFTEKNGHKITQGQVRILGRFARYQQRKTCTKFSARHRTWTKFWLWAFADCANFNLKQNTETKCH